MKKTLSLAAAMFALAACGNDVDVTTDTATVPAVDTSAGLATPTTPAPITTDTSLKTDTTKKDTTKTP